MICSFLEEKEDSECACRHSASAIHQLTVMTMSAAQPWPSLQGLDLHTVTPSLSHTLLVITENLCFNTFPAGQTLHS